MMLASRAWAAPPLPAASCLRVCPRRHFAAAPGIISVQSWPRISRRRLSRPAPAPAPPTAMLLPMRSSDVARTVMGGLCNYARRHAAQLSLLGAGAAATATLLLRSNFSAAQLVASQMGQRSENVPPDAWVAYLMASNVLAVAACGALCFSTARYMDVRRERSSELAGLLSMRQNALHRFNTDVLDRLRDQGVEDEMGTVGAFSAWYVAQLVATDAMLARLQAGGSHPSSAAEHLQAVMDRLGITAAELACLGRGELAGKRRNGVAKALGPTQSIRTRRMPGGRSRKDPVEKERHMLERLVRLRTRQDHHPAFLAYLQEMEEHLERSMQAHAPEVTPTLPAPAEPQQDPVGKPCGTDDPLATFDEGDCEGFADDPELTDEEMAQINWELSFDEWDDAGGSESIDAGSE